MIEKERHIKELYELDHINDELLNQGYDYENNLYSRILSSVLFRNGMLSAFLKKIQKNSVWMINSVLVVRNFFDYTVDKYYDKHNN